MDMFTVGGRRAGRVCARALFHPAVIVWAVFGTLRYFEVRDIIPGVLSDSWPTGGLPLWK